MSSGDSPSITIAVAAIGAVGTAFSAWLYSRRAERNAEPPQAPQHPSRHVKDGITLDIPNDLLDIDTIEQILRRIRQLEAWQRHVNPLLRRFMNALDWKDADLGHIVDDGEGDRP